MITRVFVSKTRQNANAPAAAAPPLSPRCFCRARRLLESPLNRLLWLWMLFIPLSAPAVGFQRVALPGQALTPSTRIHPLNLFGGPEHELALINGNEISLFALNGMNFELRQRVLLPAGDGTKKNRVYYGFARIAPGLQYTLLVLTPQGLFHYPASPDGIAQQPVLLAKCSFPAWEGGSEPVHYLDLAMDFDNDQADELLVPEENGFSMLHRENGAYKKVPLPRNAFKRENFFHFAQDVPSDRSRPEFSNVSLIRRAGLDDLLFYDANGDDLLDLVYSNTEIASGGIQTERYDIFFQQKGLRFDAKPSQSLSIPYDNSAQSTFRDVNNDGQLDAVVVRSNMDIINPRTVVKFYIGTGKSSQVFSRETDRFVTKDPIGLVQLNDFNNDGMQDFAMTFFSYQFGSVEDMVDLAVDSKLRFKLLFYLSSGKRGFDRQPTSEKEIVLDMKLEDFRGNPPVFLIDDLNGDHVMDLAVRSSDSQVEVFESSNGLNFPGRPAAVLQIPADSILQFDDLDGDGRADILASSTKRPGFAAFLSR